MFTDIEIYQGVIRVYRSKDVQSDFLIQDILYDTKDFFDNAFESEHYRQRSMNGDLTHDTMLDEDIDEFEADESTIELYAYSRATNFKSLSEEIQRRIKVRGRDYAKSFDGLVMSFSGSYTHFLFKNPTIRSVSYELTFNYHEKNICEVDFDINHSSVISTNAQNIRLATNLYAADTYSEEGIYFFRKTITDVLGGKFYDCENIQVTQLVDKIRKFVLSDRYLTENFADVFNEGSLKILFGENVDERVTIGDEETLNLLVSLKEPIIHNLMESGRIG